MLIVKNVGSIPKSLRSEIKCFFISYPKSVYIKNSRYTKQKALYMSNYKNAGSKKGIICFFL